MMQGVFICYRRDDGQGEAGRIDDRLRPRYGSWRVFRDVHDSPPGVSFPDHLKHTVESCRIALVVIGPRWLELLAAAQRQGYDWVRFELQLALANPEVRVIPVLVRGAVMPRPEQLPGDIRASDIYGSGYQPSGTVSLYIQGAPVGQATPDSSGQFVQVVTLPPGQGSFHGSMEPVEAVETDVTPFQRTEALFTIQ